MTKNFLPPNQQNELKKNTYVKAVAKKRLLIQMNLEDYLFLKMKRVNYLVKSLKKQDLILK